MRERVRNAKISRQISSGMQQGKDEIWTKLKNHERNIDKARQKKNICTHIKASSRLLSQHHI